MAFLRFELSLAVKEDPTGTLVAGIKIPTALATKIPAIRQAVQTLKSYASKINEGQPNEEATTRAVFHICRHDEPGNKEDCSKTERDI